MTLMRTIKMPVDRTAVDKLPLQDFIPYKLAVVANRLSQSIGSLFEQRFGIQIPDDAARNVKNLGEMAEGVWKLVEAKGAPA